MKKIILTFVITITALLATCITSFGSQAVVDSYTYRHPSKFDNCIVIDGVDVSYWQYDIDWAKVKKRGIDYAFIRIGYTGLDSPFSMNRDSYFEQNYQAAKDAGVMVGVYYYSCATTITEAKKEAQYVLDLLGGRELDMPVVFDYEFAGRIVDAYNSWSSSTRRAKMTSNALAFLNYIKTNSNYEAMFYSYRNMLDETFSSNYKFDTDLIDSQYKVWMAQYSTDNSYYRPFEFWQYTSSGSIAGINGSTDCNFWYYDNNSEKTKPGTSSIKDASITLGNTSYAYNMVQKKPVVTVTYNGAKLTKGVDYKVNYIKNALAGTGYAMVRGIGKYSNTKLVPFTITTANIADGVVADIPAKTYSGSAQVPAVKYTFKNTTFKKGVDYDVQYTNNVDAGTATVTVTGKRNFHGSMTKTFKINKADPKFTGYVSYSRTPSRPAWTINTKCDSDAQLTYKSGDTSIAKVDANGKVTLTGGTGVVYITVTSPSTKNYNAATREVKITVSADVDSNATVPFISTSASVYDKKISDGPFSLNAKTDSDGKMTFTSNNTAVASVDGAGTVTLSGKSGTAVITIKTAETNTFTSAQKTVTVNVAKDSASEGTSNKLIDGIENTTIDAKSAQDGTGIRVTWTKSYGYKMDRFEVFRSTSKSTGYGDTAYFKTSGTSYKNTKDLTHNSTYYYKIRGVREVNGKTYYSKWSDVTSVKYEKPGQTPSTPKPSKKLVDGVENTTLKASSSAVPGTITIKWKKSPGYKMDYYEVYCSLKSNVYLKPPIHTTKNGTITSLKDNVDLVPGTKYYYRIRGVRILNGKPYYSKWSNQAIRIAK